MAPNPNSGSPKPVIRDYGGIRPLLDGKYEDYYQRMGMKTKVDAMHGGSLIKIGGYKTMEAS